jgi:hypothetical protein
MLSRAPNALLKGMLISTLFFYTLLTSDFDNKVLKIAIFIH